MDLPSIQIQPACQMVQYYNDIGKLDHLVQFAPIAMHKFCPYHLKKGPVFGSHLNTRHTNMSGIHDSGNWCKV